MIRAFTHQTKPTRVVFETNAASRLAEEVASLGGNRAFIVTSARRKALAEQLAGPLGPRLAGIFARAVSHVPHDLAESAREMAREIGADCVIAFGGGAAMDLAKAVALDLPVKLLCVPTTYSGSEMTEIAGVTIDGVKRALVDPRLLPATVIYDPALTTSLDPHTTITSGMNAMAHCVEALYAPNRHPIANLCAEEGVRALFAALPDAVDTPDDLAARERALYGAYLAGLAVGTTGIALHHRLCHVLGGTFGLSHGDANAIILPHVTRYNEAHAPEAMAALRRATGAEDPACGFFDLVKHAGGPAALKEVGMPESGLDRAVDLAIAHTHYNPRPIDVTSVRNLIHAAFNGARP